MNSTNSCITILHYSTEINQVNHNQSVAAVTVYTSKFSDCTPRGNFITVSKIIKWQKISKDQWV